MEKAGIQLSLTLPQAEQYQGGPMLNIQGDTPEQFTQYLAAAAAVPDLGAFFVSFDTSSKIAEGAATAEQAVAAVTQTFPGSAPVASGATEAPGASVQPSPAAQQPAPATVTPVAVATPPAQVGPICGACGTPKVQKIGSKGVFWSCPNWRSKPAPNTLQHSQN